MLAKKLGVAISSSDCNLFGSDWNHVIGIQSLLNLELMRSIICVFSSASAQAEQYGSER